MRSGSAGKIQNCALKNSKFAHNSAPEKGLTETKICSETAGETPSEGAAGKPDLKLTGGKN